MGQGGLVRHDVVDRHGLAYAMVPPTPAPPTPASTFGMSAPAPDMMDVVEAVMLGDDEDLQKGDSRAGASAVEVGVDVVEGGGVGMDGGSRGPHRRQQCWSSTVSCCRQSHSSWVWGPVPGFSRNWAL